MAKLGYRQHPAGPMNRAEEKTAIPKTRTPTRAFQAQAIADTIAFFDSVINKREPFGESMKPLC